MHVCPKIHTSLSSSLYAVATKPPCAHDGSITIGHNSSVQEQLDTAEKDPSQLNLCILLIASWSVLRCCSHAATEHRSCCIFPNAAARVFGMLYKAPASSYHAMPLPNICRPS